MPPPTPHPPPPEQVQENNTIAKRIAKASSSHCFHKTCLLCGWIHLISPAFRLFPVDDDPFTSSCCTLCHSPRIPNPRRSPAARYRSTLLRSFHRLSRSRASAEQFLSFILCPPPLPPLPSPSSALSSNTPSLTSVCLCWAFVVHNNTTQMLRV